MVPLRQVSSIPTVSRAALSALVRKHRVPGAQLALHYSGRTTCIEVGEPEHDRRGQVRRDTAFPLGSITKSATAAVAMVLVADGDLELDEPVEEQLPDLGEAGAEVTLRQLLSHTGGWASGPDSADVRGTSLRRYVLDHCRERNRVLPPGTAFSYSNLGYVLVGLLIEEITGMRWHEAVGSVLLRPLGIEPTFVDLASRPCSGRPLASGHSVNRAEGRTRRVPQSLAPPEAPTGALALSAADLAAFALLHVGAGRPAILPTEYARQMREPVADAEPFGLADGWGLGLALFRSGGSTWVGHDGNGEGTSCHLRIDPVGGCVVAFTSNANTGSDLWVDLLGELAGAGVPVPQAPATVSARRPAPPPSAGVGTYRNGDTEYVMVAKGGQLQLSVDGDDLTPLSCREDLTFAVVDPATGRPVLDGRFVRDPRTDRIEAIQLGGRLARRHRRERRPAERRIA